MGKGGYKIIDLQHKASGSTINGIYEAIESNLYKPILLENILLSGNEITNQYVEVSISGTDFILKNDTIKVTIDDDDVVTIALNEVTPKLEEIKFYTSISFNNILDEKTTFEQAKELFNFKSGVPNSKGFIFPINVIDESSSYTYSLYYARILKDVLTQKEYVELTFSSIIDGDTNSVVATYTSIKIDEDNVITTDIEDLEFYIIFDKVILTSIY